MHITAFSSGVALFLPRIASGTGADQLMSKVSTLATQALALIYLNDHLFRIDPARLIYLVGEGQYDGYDYLAALLLYAPA